jgi:flagellar assembly factor FliW
MKVESSRFGMMELSDRDVIDFPCGVVGFPQERQFVLLRTRQDSPLGWLQSVASPALAFPVISTESLAATYDDLGKVYDAARENHITGPDEGYAVMAILVAPGGGMMATVNLLAPIIVNADSRTGGQVLLEGSAFSTHEPLTLRPMTESKGVAGKASSEMAAAG